jgi:hypothetical protein
MMNVFLLALMIFEVVQLARYDDALDGPTMPAVYQGHPSPAPNSQKVILWPIA